MRNIFVEGGRGACARSVVRDQIHLRSAKFVIDPAIDPLSEIDFDRVKARVEKEDSGEGERENRKNSPVRGWKRRRQVAGVDALSPISA